METNSIQDRIKYILTENIYLHLFNREIYRGIIGDKQSNLQCIDHTDIITTLLLCGCNPMFSSFTSYRETVNMLTEKGRLYRELYKYGIVSVCGETLNVNLNLARKQEIYFFDKERYAGYFGKEAQELDYIVPSIQKPDLTYMLDARYRGDSWEKEVLAYSLTKQEQKLLKSFQPQIQQVVYEREDKAITTSLFTIIPGPEKLYSALGRTSSGMYLDDYMTFLNADIITGVPVITEYDSFARNFPFHDYQILRLILTTAGFPCRFTTTHFFRVLEYYYSQEHENFAFKLQSLLSSIHSNCGNNNLFISTQQRRLFLNHTIRKVLFGFHNSIDLTSNDFFLQGIAAVEEIEKKITQKQNGVSIGAMNNRKVFVVSGRDEGLRMSVFNLLRALKLEPLQWDEVVSQTGSTVPHIDDAIASSISSAAAVVIIMAPEDRTQLIDRLRADPRDSKERMQPRPNVIFEAGIALGTKPEKTILLQFGEIDIFSDILGIHTLKYRKDKDQMFKVSLVEKIKTAGCNCSVNNDYLEIKIDYNE